MSRLLIIGASVHTGDLDAHVPLDVIKGQGALINCAGHVNGAETFTALVDRLVTAVDSLPVAEQPVCWGESLSLGHCRPGGRLEEPCRKDPKHRAAHVRRI